MKAENLMGEIVYGNYPATTIKEYELNLLGETFLDEFLDAADRSKPKAIGEVCREFHEDPSRLTEENVDFVRAQIMILAERALHNFRDQTLALGKEKLNGMQDTFHLEFFLQHYLDDWYHDDRVLLVDDYARYCDPIEREDFIENNPNYEDWIATDEDEMKEELDSVYSDMIDEAWENFIEDTDW